MLRRNALIRPITSTTDLESPNGIIGIGAIIGKLLRRICQYLIDLEAKFPELKVSKWNRIADHVGKRIVMGQHCSPSGKRDPTWQPMSPQHLAKIQCLGGYSHFPNCGTNFMSLNVSRDASPHVKV